MDAHMKGQTDNLTTQHVQYQIVAEA